MNEDFGMDFVARCIAGESLEVANSRQWKLIAGDNIHLDNDPATETTTISADGGQGPSITVDDALSLVSENPVQNKVITAEVNTKPTCVLPNGTVLSGQKFMALTKAQYDAIQNKDSNTYYYITDDAAGYSAGTGIDITNGVISLDADYGAGIALTLNSSTYVLTANLIDQNGTPLGSAASVDLPLETMVVSGSYDDATKKVILTLQNGSTVEFSVADLVDGLESSSHAAATYATQATVNALDVVPDVTSSDDNKVLTASYSGGVGSYAWEAVQNQIPPYGPAWALHVLSINTPGDNVIWRAIKEVPQASAADIGKVLVNEASGSVWEDIDEVPAVGSGDDGKVLTASYSGGVGSYSWETASSGTTDYTQLSNKPSINNVTLSGNKTTSDLGISEVPDITSTDSGKFLRANYYNATNTSDYSWENIPEEIPQVTSSDDGKVLTATYSGGAGSYAWATPSGGSGLQVETDGTNYWITVNGIRLYFASSAPSGTIPNGSVGIGW